MRHWALLPLLLLSAACRQDRHDPTLVLWAWERPEDLRFAAGRAEVAVEVASITLSGDEILARGRRFPLLVTKPPSTGLVHIEIDRDRPLAWTPALRAALAAAVRHYATRVPTRRVQIDFEVRSSERPILLEVLRDLRFALPRSVELSMTALASWCGEGWLDRAPVDEVVPMLFRMGRNGATVVAALAAGHDFRDPRCRTALGLSTDTPIPQAPPGRRVYLFDPRSWTRADFDAARWEVKGWR